MHKLLFVLAAGLFNYASCTNSRSAAKNENNSFNSISMENKNQESPNLENETKPHQYYSRTSSEKVNINNEEWKKILDKETYYIAREKGTEWAFSGKYYNHFEVGTYYCKACGNPLFKSNGKFESSCGWPSFFEPIKKESVHYYEDNSHGMKRIEVTCGRCESHLGHVFEDGPPPTGLRYCINSVILDFEKAKGLDSNYREKIIKH